MHQNRAEQQTAPIPQAPANPFHAYLFQHKLLWLDVARASGVPVLTVWSIDHGLAVLPTHALQVYQGLYRLTGIPYTGPINLITNS